MKFQTSNLKQLLKYLTRKVNYNYQKITTIYIDTGREPLIEFISGLPEIKGNTVLEKRRYFRENFDYIRTGIMWEPQGHADFTDSPEDKQKHICNVCVFAEGEVDLSSIGSGVSASAALHHAKGELKLNETITIESITGSTMTVKSTETCKYGPFDAVVPRVGGTANITFYFDPEDPFKDGFIFR